MNKALLLGALVLGSVMLAGCSSTDVLEGKIDQVQSDVQVLNTKVDALQNEVAVAKSEADRANQRLDNQVRTFKK